MKKENNDLRDWITLDDEEQTRLRIENGHYLDSLPPMCSLEAKIERFRTLLMEEKAILYNELHVCFIPASAANRPCG